MFCRSTKGRKEKKKKKKKKKKMEQSGKKKSEGTSVKDFCLKRIYKAR